MKTSFKNFFKRHSLDLNKTYDGSRPDWVLWARAKNEAFDYVEEELDKMVVGGDYNYIILRMVKRRWRRQKSPYTAL